MIATLLATLFTGTALLAIATMVLGWRHFGFRFRELRNELRATHDPLTIRYAWRSTSAPQPSAVIYNLDFKAKAEGLPFHPELRPELSAAA